MLLIVGLGNPGKDYEGSRHNAGFRVIELLSRQVRTGLPEKGSTYLYQKSSYRNNSIILAQPLTYMNRSGYAVVSLLKVNKIKPEDMLVIYDELDLPPGTIRLKRGGGSAGHRGVQSIIDVIGTESFDRLRVGIGKPPVKTEGGEYVLGYIDQQEKILLEEAIERAAKATLTYISEGINMAMNLFNRGVE